MPPGSKSHIRKLAEEKAGAEKAQSNSTLTPAETKHLLHELQVHQFELEMQNEELRHIQEELQTSVARYFDLYNMAPVGYCTLDENGKILEANLTASTLLHMSRNSLIGRNLQNFFIPGDNDLYYLHQRRLFESEEPQSYELRLISNENSQLWIRLEATLVYDANERPVCRVVMSDITTSKKAEESINQINAQLQAVNNEKDKFFSILAHDLRSPFNSLLGLTQVLSEKMFELSKDEMRRIVNSLRKTSVG